MEFHPAYAIGVLALILGFAATLVATIKGAGLPVRATLGVLDPRPTLREDWQIAKTILRKP